MTGEADEAMRYRGVPHPNALVVPSAHHTPTIVPNRQRAYGMGMAAYLDRWSAYRSGIPHEHPPIVSAGNHPPVRQNRDRPHHIAMAAEVYRGLGRSRIPQTNTTIATAGDHPPVGQQC
jgi:hypothetical protein